MIDGATAVDDPHVVPGTANVCAPTREPRPAPAIPVEQVARSIGPGNVVAISAVDGRQFSRNVSPLGFSRQHAIDIVISVDNPLLAVGTNGDMGTSTRKLTPATILVLVQFLCLVSADSAFMSPRINLEVSVESILCNHILET